MDKLNFIGRGSAFTKNEVNNSAYLIKDDTLILFDCGCDVFKQIVNKKILFLDGVKRLLILITHMHDDHVGSLTSLLEYCKYSDRAGHIEEVMIFDSFLDLLQIVPAAPYKSRIDTYLNIFDFSLNSLSKVKLVSQSQVQDDLGIIIRALSVPHSNLCYAYLLIDSDGSKIYYSGDTSSHDQALSQLMSSVDCHIDLYLEASSAANKYYKSSVHYAEFQIPELINRIEEISEENNLTYTVNLMHIDDFDTYSELSKKLIVNTI